MATQGFPLFPVPEYGRAAEKEESVGDAGPKRFLALCTWTPTWTLETLFFGLRGPSSH